MKWGHIDPKHWRMWTAGTNSPLPWKYPPCVVLLNQVGEGGTCVFLSPGWVTLMMLCCRNSLTSINCFGTEHQRHSYRAFLNGLLWPLQVYIFLNEGFAHSVLKISLLAAWVWIWCPELGAKAEIPLLPCAPNTPISSVPPSSSSGYCTVQQCVVAGPHTLLSTSFTSAVQYHMN